MTNKEIGSAMTIKLDPVLPEYPVFKEGIRRAPMRELTLSDHEKKLAVKNALRYVPEELHEALAPEFMEELLSEIYGAVSLQYVVAKNGHRQLVMVNEGVI